MRLHPIGRLFFISILAVVLASCASEPKKTAARAVKNIPLKPGAVTQAELDRRPAAVRKRVEAAIDKALETKKYGELEALLEKGEWTIYDLKKVYDKKDAVLAEMLLRYGCVNIDARYEDFGTKDRGSTLLLLASGLGDLTFLKLFLRYGYDPNTTDKRGLTPLFRLVFNSFSGTSSSSILNYRMEAVRFLLANGADVNVKFKTPIQLLINGRRVDANGRTIAEFVNSAEKARGLNLVFPGALPADFFARLQNGAAPYSARKEEIDDFLELNSALAEKLEAEYVRAGKTEELKRNVMMYSLWEEYTKLRKMKQESERVDREMKVVSAYYKTAEGGLPVLSKPVQPADASQLAEILRKSVEVREIEPKNEFLDLLADLPTLAKLGEKYKMKLLSFKSGNASPAAPAKKISPGRGFDECRIGDSLETALARLGPPEAEVRIQFDLLYLEYPSGGFRLHVGNDTKEVRGQFFYFRSPRYGQFLGGTSEGIGKDSTVSDVLDAYGLPEKEVKFAEAVNQGDFAGAQERILSYSSRGIAFVFHNGRLSFFSVFRPVRGRS